MRVAIVGATGNVGRAVLAALEERVFPLTNLAPLASSTSTGAQVSFCDRVLPVQNADTYDYAKEDIVFFCADTQHAQRLIPKITQTSKAFVIDKSSAYRLDPHVPLVVPEINPEAISWAKKRIIASPNCVSIPLALTLFPLQQLASISKVIVSTYQSVSGAGVRAMDELTRQTKATFVAESYPPEVFPKPIAFNVIPHIDAFEEDDFTGEELKITREIKKILSPHIQVTPTCVRVPVFVGHAASVTVSFDKKITVRAARNALKVMPGIQLLDNPKDELYTTPLDAQGEDHVFVSRVRQNPRTLQDLTFWFACDNLRKGAGLNAVQIAELLLKRK